VHPSRSKIIAHCTRLSNSKVEHRVMGDRSVRLVSGTLEFWAEVR